ncbi:MAG TPA: hypothetical protein VGO59_19605 [Verrucomicrobiae bacterium]|jgi:hypothetical protein
MSLINDALKRASQSDRNRQRETVRKHAPMEPAATPPAPSSSMLAAICVIVALALAAFFFWQWWGARRPVAPVKLETAAAPRPVVRLAAPPRSAPAPAAANAQAAVMPPPAIAPAPAIETALASPAKPVPPPPWPVELKLMGIFFNQANPQALINARTVSVGDEIDGIRVTRIARDQVTVGWNGQSKQLTLE